MLRAIGKPRDPDAARPPSKLLRAGAAAARTGATSNKDGHYDDDAAVTLMDAWWPRLRSADVQAGDGQARCTHR